MVTVSQPLNHLAYRDQCGPQQRPSRQAVYSGIERENREGTQAKMWGIN